MNPRLVLGLALAAYAASFAVAAELPRSWIDPDTGHRVVQLSVEPGSSSLYFTQYAYTAGGTKLLMTTRHGIDLVTVATGAIEPIFEGHVDRVLQAGRKTGAIYYAKGGFLYALDPVTKQSRQLAAIPAHGSLVTVNADETLAAGAVTGGGDRPDLRPKQPVRAPGSYAPGQAVPGGDDYPDKMAMMTRRLAAHLPMTLFTIDLRTGERRDLLQSTDWLNHFQFSPTDPTLMSFSHEGPWWMVDRVWLFRADGHSQPLLVHQRTMKGEIANHEYWSADGQWIWYDLETPMNEVFWVAGYNVSTGQRLWYHLTLDQWSIHYNRSPDGTLFSGDGGATDDLGPHPPHSKWIYLFHPEMVPDLRVAPAGTGLIQIGTFRTEKLVNLAQHAYSLEPNGNFTPDGKWVVFHSNMRGPSQVFAVEVAKAAGAATAP
jgi:oligogalacturonide lyase